ncbi:hypothetical protein ACFT7S_23585 [Streptomyces sp. NPDC057136]|uniref:hypothetical protein n=1 Tax=Streptomyces sp. NPDC057136 TaxID=3346029 RepID=UPI0036352EAF
MGVGGDGGGTTPETDDRGCLRRVLGVPLVLLHLMAAAFCWTALTIRASGPWDDGALAGIELSCMLTIAIGAVALLITAAPSVRRAMGPWWFAPPVALIATAVVRWVLLD